MVYTSGERVKEIVRIFTKYGLSYIVDVYKRQIFIKVQKL